MRLLLVTFLTAVKQIVSKKDTSFCEVWEVSCHWAFLGLLPIESQWLFSEGCSAAQGHSVGTDWRHLPQAGGPGAGIPVVDT